MATVLEVGAGKAYATINAAVTAAKSIDGKVEIVISSGDYNENVSFGSRTFVEDGTTYVGGITFKAADGEDVNVNGYFQCNGVAGDLKDIAFDGLNITSSVRNGGYFAPIMFGDNYSGKKASGISVTDCTINSSTGSASGTCSGIALTMGLICDGITISNNTINADCGVYGGDGNLISNTVISGNTMNGNEAEPSYGYWGVVYIYNNGEGNVISGNTIDNSALKAIKLNKGNGVVVTNNTITDCEELAIVKGSVISGNTVDGEEISFPIYDGSDVFVYDKVAGNNGDIVIIDDIAYEVGKDVFADVNAAAAVAEKSAGKLVVMEGANVTYTANQWFLLNAPAKEIETDKWNYDYVVDASETYDLQIDGTLGAYQLLLNNAETVVSSTGKLFATGEVLRVMGGSITVDGVREAGAGAPEEIFTGNWGIGTKPGADTQIKAGYMQINQGAVADFNNTVVFINAGWMNFNDAAADFSNTYIYLGSGGSYAPIAVELVNGAEVTFTDNTTVINDKTFTMNITVDATSTLTLSADSSITATTLTVADGGKFIIDASNFSGYKKVVDLSGASLEGKVTIEGEGVTAIYGEDGDVTLSTVDVSTVFVNAEYTGEFGADLGNGKFFGVNAFADFESALAAASKNTAVTRIEIESDLTANSVANTSDYFNISQKLVIGTANGADYKVAITPAGSDSMAVKVQGDGASLTIEEGVDINWLDVTAVGFWTKNEEMVIDGKLSAKSLKIWTSDNGITVSESGKVDLGHSDGQLDFNYGNGFLNVTGTLADTADASLTDGPQVKAGYSSVQSYSDGSVMNLTNTYFEGGAWFTVNGKNFTANMDNSVLKVSGGDFVGSLTVNGTGNVFNVENGSRLIVASVTVGADNKIVVDNSALKINTLTNNGLVQVYGESTLDIASASGETVDFMDGAIIKDSTVGGGVFVAGNVTFRGDNTFGMITDFGTLTDYYGTTAPMAWTVEAGASVTLSNKARYGLGYGDKVVINGEIAENGAAAARATLEDDDAANDVKQSLFMHGLVAQESKGWDCDSSFTVNNAFVTIGENSSFGNKPANYGGAYTFNFNNSVLNASRITFYEALSTSEFTFKDSDVKTGQFMTRDQDSVFTLDNTNFLSTATSNGTDEGNYNAAELNVTNGSTLTYSAKMFNEATGVINVDNATFVAPEVDNSNEFNVSGESTLDIATLSGNAIQAADGTTLTDSKVGGKVQMLGDLNFAGDNEIKTIAGTNGGTLTVEDGKTLALNNFSFGNSNNNTAEYVITGGKITASYGFFQHGKYTLESDFETGYMYYSYGSDITVTGSFHSQGKGDGLDYVRGKLTIADGGESIHDKSLWVGQPASWGEMTASLTVDAGGYVQASTLNVYAGSSLSIAGAVKANTLENTGVITITAMTGTVEADSLAGDGTITIDGTDFSGTKKVIDLSGTASLAGKVTLVNGEGMTMIYGADGDVTITDASADMIYVDSAWAGKVNGTEVEAGKVIGVNAFSNLTDAVKAAENNGGATIDLTDEAYSGNMAGPADAKLFQTNGTYTFINGNYVDFAYVDTPRPSEENAGLVDVNIVFDGAKVTAGKFRLDNGSSLTIKDSYMDAQLANSASVGWTSFYGDSTITVDNSVIGWNTYNQSMESSEIVAGDRETNYYTHDAHLGNMCYWGSSVMTVTGSTVFSYVDEGANAVSFGIYDKGLVSFKDSAVYAQSVKIGVSGYQTVGRDDEVATMVFDNSTWRNTLGRIDDRIIVGEGVVGKLVIKNGSVVEKSGAALTVNKDSVVEIENSTVDINNATVYGSLNLAGADFTADKVSGTRATNDVAHFNINASVDAEGNAVTTKLNIGAIDTMVVDVNRGDDVAGKVVLSGNIGFAGDTCLRPWNDVTLSNLTINDNGTVKSNVGKLFTDGDIVIKDNSDININWFQVKGNAVIEEGSTVSAPYVNIYDHSTLGAVTFTLNGTLKADTLIITNSIYKEYYKTNNYEGVSDFVVGETGIIERATSGAAARFDLQLGKMTVYGYVNQKWDAAGGTAYIGNDGYSTSLTVDGTYAAADNNKGKFINSGTQNMEILEGSFLNVVNGGTFSWASAVKNDGAISIEGNFIVADTLTNNGSVTVTGESTVNIATLSGNYVKFEDATIVGDSAVGGNIRTFGDFEVAADFTTKQSNFYGTTTIKSGAVYTGSTTIVGTGSEFTLENGGTINSRFFNVAGGTANINGAINLVHSDPRQKLLQIHEESVANINEGGVVTITKHNAIVHAGGTLNVNGGSLTITADTVNVAPERGGVIYNAGTVNVNDGLVDIKTLSNTSEVVVNGGTLDAENMDLLSNFKLSGLTAGEARTITVAFMPEGETDGGFTKEIAVTKNATSIDINYADIVDGKYNITVIDGTNVITGSTEIVNGTLDVNGGKLVLGALNVGKGEVNVTGESTVVIEKQSGVVNVNDGAVLTDSKLGTVYAYGYSEWKGTNTIDQFSLGWYNSGDFIEVSMIGTANVKNFMIGNVEGFTSRLNIGSEDGERTTVNGNQHNYTTNSDVYVVNADVTGNYVSMTGSVTVTDSTYSGFGDFRVVAGSKHTIDPRAKFVKSSITGAYGYIGGCSATAGGYGVLELINDSTWKSTGGSCATAASTITLDNSDMIIGGTFTMYGTLTMDVDSMIAFKGIDLGTTGSITIDMAAIDTASGNKLFDRKDAGWTVDNYKALISNWDSSMDKFFAVDAEGDLIVKANAVAYVNGEYTDASKNQFATHEEAIASGAVRIITTGGTVQSMIGFNGIESVITDGSFAGTVSGGAVTSGDYKDWKSFEGDANLTISGGSFDKMVIGGERVNSGSTERIGDINLTITDGIFDTNVVGGMLYADRSIKGQALLVGNVNMTITGGEFHKFIYGGNITANATYANRTAIEGDVNITVDASGYNTMSFLDTANIYAGSYRSGAIVGNVQVTFSGLGENITWGDRIQVWGGCSGDYYDLESGEFFSSISGSRTFTFDAFSGDFGATIGGFETIEVVNDTDVNMLKGTLANIENWVFEADSSLSGNFVNDFAGDTLNIDLGDWDGADTVLMSGAESIFSGIESLAGVTVGSEALTFDGVSKWANASYELEFKTDENDSDKKVLAFSKLA